MESPLHDRVWLVSLADMAHTFEYVLHFVRCDMVTMSPNQSIIIMIIMISFIMTECLQAMFET